MPFPTKYSFTFFFFTLADGRRPSRNAGKGLLSFLYRDDGSEAGSSASDDDQAAPEGPAGPTPPVSAPRRAPPPPDPHQAEELNETADNAVADVVNESDADIAVIMATNFDMEDKADDKDSQHKVSNLKLDFEADTKGHYIVVIEKLKDIKFYVLYLKRIAKY